jgi:GT2 family glycosyltransferase
MSESIYVKRIAALYTCFNRKDKTLQSLNHLKKALDNSKESVELDIFITDDGSTDGTTEAIRSFDSKIYVIQGTGDLFWANGMNSSWRMALQKGPYDGYLLLNDDTNVFPTLFDQLKLSETLCEKKHGSKGIYVGSTQDPSSKKLSYGGAIIVNKWLYKFKKRIPNGDIQNCALGNANILYSSREVVDQIGTLSEGYKHGVADFDYTLKAKKKKIPVVVMPEFNGTCENDHRSMYHGFEKKSLKQRIEYLYHPLGVDFSSRLKFMKRFFPYRYPLFYLVGWFKVLFPALYKSLFSRK